MGSAWAVLLTNMGKSNFQIVFDNPWGKFIAGQPVTGKVLLGISSPEAIRGIKLHFQGEGYVAFRDTNSIKDEDGNERTETRTYSNSETYLDQMYYILGGTGVDYTMARGAYIYPFQMALPFELPSSFEGTYGHIRYSVTAIVDRPWTLDWEVYATITVGALLDLNMMLICRIPVQLTRGKSFCFCCLPRGSLRLAVSIPVSGCVSGEMLPVSVEVHNNSSRVEIYDVVCQLQQLVRFYGQLWRTRKTREERNIVSELSFGMVSEHTSQTWTRMLAIPPLPPSNLTYCGIIDIDYVMEVEARVSPMYHCNLTVRVPIIIGTVPLVPIHQPEVGFAPTFSQSVPLSPPFN